MPPQYTRRETHTHRLQNPGGAEEGPTSNATVRLSRAAPLTYTCCSLQKPPPHLRLYRHGSFTSAPLTQSSGAAAEVTHTFGRFTKLDWLKEM